MPCQIHSANKGFWAEILGVGNFYFELGVQILDVCLQTRAQNGGLISFAELMEALTARRGSGAQAINVYVIFAKSFIVVDIVFFFFLHLPFFIYYFFFIYSFCPRNFLQESKMSRSYF
jgi:hypothetical protein